MSLINQTIKQLKGFTFKVTVTLNEICTLGRCYRTSFMFLWFSGKTKRLFQINVSLNAKYLKEDSDIVRHKIRSDCKIILIIYYVIWRSPVKIILYHCRNYGSVLLSLQKLFFFSICSFEIGFLLCEMYAYLISDGQCSYSLGFLIAS